MRGDILRVLADGLINGAETLQGRSDAARHLRDAAASLLDADCALEREADGANLLTFPKDRKDAA